MWNMVCSLRTTIAVIAVLVVTGCSTLGPKILPKGQVKGEFAGLYIRPLQNKPTTWLTVKLINNSDKTFTTRTTRVVDITNAINLYGENVGYVSSGFNSSADVAWPKDLEVLEPGKIGYVSVNVGDPKGPVIEMSISLNSQDKYTAIERVSINLEGVVPVNQMPGN